MTLHHGDCVEVMAAMDPESIDAIVTDPPYGLEFMGKEWDRLDANHRVRRAAEVTPAGQRHTTSAGPFLAHSVAYRGGAAAYDFHHEWATAAYRVAKPSAYLLAFGGTRTVHRLTCALEDAGWVIRDTLVWGYASGFPKSKASLKPAWEPIVMARKPGPLRELAIDACRIGYVSDEDREQAMVPQPVSGYASPVLETPSGRNGETFDPKTGRWPANIVLTDPIFDGGWEGVVGGGETSSGRLGIGHAAGNTFGVGNDDKKPYDIDREYGGDSGTYSRFFLIPKADRADREPVLGGQLPVKDQPSTWDDIGPVDANPRKPDNGHVTRRENVHPTVKPTDLMRHLVRLVTPAGGTVLDPFLGSGTTGIACELEGFPWVGIEREEEYVRIAEARLNGTQKGLGI